MQQDHIIIQQVYAAKDNLECADALIRSYIPFIKREVSKFLSRICTGQDDEYSIGLMAFHEAIQSYEKQKGSFLNFAALIIKSRLIDYNRQEERHMGQISLFEDDEDEEDLSMFDKLADPRDYYEERSGLEATKEEIAELALVMKSFGISLTDVADNCPKQERTLQACGQVVRCAVSNPELLEELLRTKKLPIANLAAHSGVSKKTLERHRKYILAMLLIQTNGYEIIRGHIKHVLNVKGGAST